MENTWKYQSLQISATDLVKELRKFLFELESVYGPSKFAMAGKDLFDDTPLADLDLSVRANNCMRNEGLQTIGDFLAREERELLRVPNFGIRSLNEIKDAIKAHRERKEAAQ